MPTYSAILAVGRFSTGVTREGAFSSDILVAMNFKMKSDFSRRQRDRVVRSLDLNSGISGSSSF